jgi:hypothetical protein
MCVSRKKYYSLSTNLFSTSKDDKMMSDNFEVQITNQKASRLEAEENQQAGNQVIQDKTNCMPMKYIYIQKLIIFL